jgi:hypothetical protein
VGGREGGRWGETGQWMERERGREGREGGCMHPSIRGRSEELDRAAEGCKGLGPEFFKNFYVKSVHSVATFL